MLKCLGAKQFVNVEISARFNRNLARFIEISTRYGWDLTRFVTVRKWRGEQRGLCSNRATQVSTNETCYLTRRRRMLKTHTHHWLPHFLDQVGSGSNDSGSGRFIGSGFGLDSPNLVTCVCMIQVKVTGNG